MGIEMEPTEIFRTSLRYMLDKSEHSQAELARVLGISPQRINDYLGKRNNFSEHRRQQIATFFNMGYLEMLTLGYKLETGETLSLQAPPAPTSEKTVIEKVKRLSQPDLMLVEALLNRLSKND